MNIPKRADILAFILFLALIGTLLYYVHYLNSMLHNNPCQVCERERGEDCQVRINPFGYVDPGRVNTSWVLNSSPQTPPGTPYFNSGGYPK